jgi:sugar lactone lactonase YvrE
MSFERIEGLQCVLGESPVWDRDRLRLVDIPGRRLHQVVDGRGDAGVELAERVTAIVPVHGDRWLAVYGRSIGWLDPAGGDVAEWLAIPGDADVELNDAVAARDGRLYVGSVDRTGGRRGELYAIGADRVVEVVATGIGASNGIDSTADGSAIVYADSFADAITWLPSGRIAAVPHPDGLAVDADGCVWVASWGHGELRRLTSEGEVERVVPVPVVDVTNVAFGGADLDELYITTARSNGRGGEVLRYSPGVRGLAVSPLPFDWP